MLLTWTPTIVCVQFASEPVDGSRDAGVSALYADRALCLLRLTPPAAEPALADCELALQADDSNAKASLPWHSEGLITGYVILES